MAIERTSRGLRGACFDEIDNLISGEATPERARSLASLAHVVISATKLDLEVYKLFAAEEKPIARLPDVSL